MDTFPLLKSMFPKTDSNYLREIIKQPPNPNVNVNNKEELLNFLIDHLLTRIPTEEELIPDEPTVDEQYLELLEIFEDADPTFLRKFVEENYGKENALEEFIERNLQNRSYPTRDQYLANLKKTQQMKEYTACFQVEKFLETIPDPIAYFEDAKRKCHYEAIAYEFLKSHFVAIKVATISQTYRRANYNITLTAKQLSIIKSDMKTRRKPSAVMLTENIPLLQEIAFIKNRDAVEDYIRNKKQKELQEYQQLEATNSLLVCQCCFEDKCVPSKVSRCEAGHIFCNDCVVRGVDDVLGKGETKIKCFTDCVKEFSLQALQQALKPTKFSKLLIKIQAAEVLAAQIEGLVTCPFCPFASIPPPEDRVFKCLNPECMKESCRLCQGLNHVPLKCDEVVGEKSEKARLMIEERMTRALLRTCYKCKTQFYKEEGCNKMTCVKCFSLMCYICDKPVEGYAHFAGQGSVNSSLCPLWSDDRYMNAVTVRKAAEDAEKEILQQNPDIKIDTKNLLPAVPQRTKGPHDDIRNANQLPVHYQNVAASSVQKL